MTWDEHIATAGRELLWSLWSEHGVPGGVRHHRHFLLDPEPLVVCTPALATEDPRLLGLVLDWCAAHSALLLKPRITQLAATSSEATRQELAAFNGALANEGVRCKPAAEPMQLERDRRTMNLPMERPSLLALRMRALFGPSTRSDVLTILATSPHTDLTAEQLTPSGVSRRSVERLLSELQRAGFVTTLGKKRGRRFVLKKRNLLADFARVDGTATTPAVVPVDWHALLSAILLIRALSARTDRSTGLRNVEAVRCRAEILPLLHRIQEPEPPEITGKKDAFERLEHWAGDFAVGWANGTRGPKLLG